MPSRPTPVVETTIGRVSGLSGGDVLSFLGMQYGIAERFCPPQPAPAFTGIRAATRHGLAAPQNLTAAMKDDFLSWYSEIGEMGEACQVLNVHTPACDTARRPVMVWLHGGGWMNFAGAVPGTDGSALAQSQDVVVVTLNHRLGALGFLALETTDDRYADAGNAGLLDVVLALNWIRENIAAFGGDPANVTLFGQSGGAAKVAALMAMPLAKGLFHKVILQSLSGGRQIAPREEAHQIADTMLRTAGVRHADELARLPLPNLLAAQAKMPRTFRPVIDGRNFLRHPFAPDAPPESAGIPMLAGCTDTESTFYMRDHPDSFAIGSQSLLTRLQRFLATSPDETCRIMVAYRNSMPGTTPADILIAVTTDHIFKRNTYRAAALQGQRGAATYAYVFSRQTPVDGGRLGAPHCADVPFIFGSCDLAAGCVGTGPDIRPMTELMMSTWAAFARNGTPANPLLPDWRPYSDADQPVMDLQLMPALLPAPGATARTALDGVAGLEYSVDRTLFLKG